MDNAVKECLLGSLSFNGQRCTALKIIFVHKDIREKFLAKFSEEVDKLKVRRYAIKKYVLIFLLQMGLPWEQGVNITPLPEPEKPKYLHELIEDALKHGNSSQIYFRWLIISIGAKVINPRGHKADRTFVAPTVLFPVDERMRVYHEEQFGPLIPVREFEDLNDIYKYLDASNYGQQASVFTRDEQSAAKLVDVLVNQVC